MIPKKHGGAVAAARSESQERLDYPVLLVSGFGAPAFHNDWVAKQLARNGLDVHKMMLPNMAIGDMRESAKLVSGEVEGIKALAGSDKVSLVGYSLGGLIARIYLQELGGTESLGRAVFVGAPQDGIYTAYLAAWTKAGRQVCKGSDFMREINSGRPCGCDEPRCLAIFLSRDGTILPAASARLGCGYNLELVWPVLHWGLVFNPGVVRVATDFLKGGMPEGVVIGVQE